MNVLSLFDGMSCGQIALERAGIKVDKYFASEIDKYAIKVTMAHYPNTIQLGDILNWRSWNLPKIDLLIGGSPCQGFSNAGLGLNFEDPRSKLFFTYVDILNDLKEKNLDLQFLLENVKMKKEWQKIITQYMSVESVLINSALVSAQNRQRLYWANWKIEQPEDRHIYLKDIIEEGDVDRDKSYTIDANYFKGGSPRSNFEDGKRQLVFEHQSHKRAMVKTIGHGYMKESMKEMDKYPSLYGQSPSSKHLLVQVGIANIETDYEIAKRVYSPKGKSPSIRAFPGSTHPKIALDDFHYRKLTPIECERLQTVEDNWTNMVSSTQRYKMLGNGWTIDVIVHILNSNPNLR